MHRIYENSSDTYSKKIFEPKNVDIAVNNTIKSNSSRNSKKIDDLNISRFDDITDNSTTYEFEGHETFTNENYNNSHQNIAVRKYYIKTHNFLFCKSYSIIRAHTLHSTYLALSKNESSVFSRF